MASFTHKVIQGYPVVGPSGYLHGKIDTIVEVHTELTQSSNSRNTVLKDVVALIIDAKPKLVNISSTLDQINAYVRLLDFDKNYKNLEKRMKVIITFDPSGRFDSMLAEQGIYVYHIHDDENNDGCCRCGANGVTRSYDKPSLCDECKKWVIMCHYCHEVSPPYFGEIADYIISDDCCSKDICQKCGTEIGENEEQFENDVGLPTLWLCWHCYWDLLYDESGDDHPFLMSAGIPGHKG